MFRCVSFIVHASPKSITLIMDDEQKIELDIEITIKLTGLISSTLSANLALKSKARSRWVYPGTLLIYRMEVEQLVIFDLYSDE